jgi:hypothetical protein
VTPSLAVVSASLPLVGVGLMTCSNVDARSSTQQILQYLESLKDVEADQEGIRFSFTALGCLFL